MSRLPVPLAAAGTMVATTLPTTAQGTQVGRALFLSHCAVCHQDSGAGGLETTYHNGDALILRAILEGKVEEGGPLDAPMPRWKGQLTEQQAEQILT